MTREEVKEILPLMETYSKGKTIQIKSNDKWVDLHEPDFRAPIDRYRIKPEPKYRPFKTQEECWQEMQKHQPFGWIKCEEGYFNIVYVNDTYAGLSDKDNSAILLASINSYKDNTFVDGTPFGIKED